ncbi:nicotinamidase-like amidase [Xenococcus sp. PCC 7305]|uniref:cysteine hydrolase family protein n=1 Tax=Xenococcus sp. PCC 7305 TaxID=102125 RepID=UPI0002ACF226|nr:isochorismatase family cysteine hydrolase [Xenococcus sp. PCC 7305]ELS02870.1 nicotinamidase-like amidase [Xenococcus sp. PCC 7305]
MNFNLDCDRTALLIIDFQADVFDGGALQIVGTEAVLPKAKQVLAAARTIGLPIIHTQEVHRKEMVDFGRELDGVEPVHCLENWAGTDFHPELYPRDGEYAIAKRRYSSFFGTDLEILLRGLKVDTLIIMGTMTNVCVHYTVADAHQKDYNFYVIEDCCAGSDWDAHWAALKAMKYLQRNSLINSQIFLNQTGVTQQIAAEIQSISRAH